MLETVDQEHTTARKGKKHSSLLALLGFFAGLLPLFEKEM